MGAFGGILRLFARAPLLLLTAFFFVVGAILALLGLVFGFSLDDVDRWIDAHASWFSLIGDILFRIGSGFVLLICVAAVLAWIFDRKNPERPGIGCVLAALVVGYLAWIGMTAAL